MRPSEHDLRAGKYDDPISGPDDDRTTDDSYTPPAYEFAQNDDADAGAYDTTGMCEAHPSRDRNKEVTTIISPNGTLKVLKSAPPELVAGLVLHSLDLYDAALLQVTQ